MNKVVDETSGITDEWFKSSGYQSKGDHWAGLGTV